MTLENQIAKQLEKLEESKNNRKKIVAEVNLGFIQLGIDANSRLGLLVKALGSNTDQAKKTVHNLVEDLKMDLNGNDYDL